MSSYLTAVGSIIVSVGVLLVGASQTKLGSVVVVLGLIVASVGLVVVVREEKRKQEEHDLHVRREKSSIIILAHIAEGLGVDMDKVRKMMEDKLDDK
ncbi:MAG: hypothetical protein Q7S81_01340 [bacterium]|nr:hypothetical protein [bacterium]